MKNNDKLITGIAGILLILFMTVPGFSSDKLEEGTVTGKIERVDEKFLRDYEKMDYKGASEWEKWGKGLKSLGWIVVKGSSDEPKDYFLVVINTRTDIQKSDGTAGTFNDLKPGDRVKVSYRMGWDALHGLSVGKLNQLGAETSTDLP